MMGCCWAWAQPNTAGFKKNNRPNTARIPKKYRPGLAGVGVRRGHRGRDGNPFFRGGVAPGGPPCPGRPRREREAGILDPTAPRTSRPEVGVGRSASGDIKKLASIIKPARGRGTQLVWRGPRICAGCFPPGALFTMLKKTTLLAAALALCTAIAVPLTAQAQWTNQSTIYGQPQFGGTWSGPHGQTYTVSPTIYGQPQFGSTITGPGGHTTTCTPTIYGQPQFGTNVPRMKGPKGGAVRWVAPRFPQRLAVRRDERIGALV